MPSFKAKIHIIGVNPYMLIPASVLSEIFKQAGKNKGPIPVHGTLNGKKYKQTLVKFSGKWRFYLNTPMRRAAGIDVGDSGEVEMEFDPSSRIIPTHPALTKAFLGNKKAKSVFEKLPAYRQKEISRYLGFLKTEESLKRNLEKVLLHLNGKGRFAGRD